MNLQDRPRIIAETILTGFDEYRQQFKRITRQAKERFENADWPAAQQAAIDRIKLYKSQINGVFIRLDEILQDEHLELSEWRQIKAAYETLIRERKDFDLAETVFNTVFRKSHVGKNLTDDYAFVHEPLQPTPEFNIRLARHYGPSTDLTVLLGQVFKDYRFSTSFLDIENDIELMVGTMKENIPLLRTNREIRFELLWSIFYRNKGAYLIGRMYIDEHLFPIAIPIQNDGSGLFVDTVIWNENDLSIIFSFTRSYFMVDVEFPHEMIKYLSELLPGKKTWELYMSVGFYKHGKTEFYRGFLNHLENSDDDFVIAEGIKGLVMTVFTMPSYHVVFKIIKDRFSPTKNITREQVKKAYYLAKTHDRVGRMADTQEFSDILLPRSRFSEALLTELSSVAASSVTITDEDVYISHLYTERLMTPLNLYIQDKSGFKLKMALDEYGNAIKQLAAANIFPGDMLLKNFGVTRHGRVVFYDYDEICYLTDIKFRKIPPPRYPEDEYAAEPWYSIDPNDVFPEEFRNFLFSSKEIEEIFCEFHEDLFSVDYWHGLQKNIRDSQVMDVFPYRRKRRFDRRVENQNQIKEE